MLFDRFIFILYLLLCYTWFLLGTLYLQPLRYVSIVSMIVSLLSIIVISLCQLQILVERESLSTSDKWSTIAWSTVHIFVGVIFCIDGIELTNPVVLFGVLGLLMTVVILVVTGCACFVIIQSGEDWQAHVHLVCVTFWVIVQYMTLRLPVTQIQFITTIPIVLMACIRTSELSREQWFQYIPWFVCIIIHITRDMAIIEVSTFCWILVSVILILSASQWRTLVILTMLPFALLPLFVYICCACLFGKSIQHSLVSIAQMYNEFVKKDMELIVLPLDGDYDGRDWDESL